MNSQLFTQLVVGVILVLGAIISAYVVPWIQVKIEGTVMADFVSFVEKCVKWANQTIPPEEWEKKKQEVLKLVKEYVEKHTKLDLSDSEIDAIIEAIVYSVKHKD